MAKTAKLDLLKQARLGDPLPIAGSVFVVDPGQDCGFRFAVPAAVPLPAGSNGMLLVLDSTQPTGLRCVNVIDGGTY
jgi:hypothetical protein